VRNSFADKTALRRFQVCCWVLRFVSLDPTQAIQRPYSPAGGGQEGSIYLSDQKVPVRVPRVRDVTKNKEVPLESYRLLQEPGAAEEEVMRRILCGLSCRNDEGCAEAVPEAFGISSTTISRRFIKVSAK
jgi:hypothetical protein